jgi:PAS domain S-box-containing protein
VSEPPPTLLADVFRHLPFIVVHTTTDGTVLHLNPETSRITGYEPRELLGKNLFAILFPGKLFAQVPKFISLIEPSPLLKDIPMTIRTKGGQERIIAFSRYVHIGPVSVFSDSAPRTFICVGVDLTDRLTDADREKLPPSFLTESEVGSLASFGPNVGNGGAIDGEFVTPIAISPKAPRDKTAQGPCPVEQTREALAKAETHLDCVLKAVAEGESHTLAALTRAAGIPVVTQEKFTFISRGQWLHTQMTGSSMGVIRARVDELLALYRPEMA